MSARERQAEFLAAQVLEIADTLREGKKVRISQKDGVTEEHGDQVDRLMVDARKWLASKLAPKKYGDKIEPLAKPRWWGRSRST